MVINNKRTLIKINNIKKKHSRRKNGMVSSNAERHTSSSFWGLFLTKGTGLGEKVVPGLRAVYSLQSGGTCPAWVSANARKPTLGVLGQYSEALVKLVCSSLEVHWRKPCSHL